MTNHSRTVQAALEQGLTNYGTEGCWPWVGRISGTAGPAIRVQGKVLNASRAAYEEWVRPIETGRAIRRNCDTRFCMNPAHLRATLSPCVEDGCERPRHANSMCKMHYRRIERANGRDRSPSDAWSDSRRNHRAKRAALTRGATVAERISKRAVYERDAWTCGICLDPVDATLAHPHPMSVSLDHVLALAHGGTHTYENVQCSHLQCNLRKGDRPAQIAS